MAASDLLAEVNAAISKCLISQAYTVKQREQKFADLDKLRLLRRDLIAEAKEETSSGGSMSSVGQIDRPV